MKDLVNCGDSSILLKAQSATNDAGSEINRPVRVTLSNKILAKVASKEMDELLAPFQDSSLLANTIAQWTRPLPEEYLNMPLILVGPSGVGKNRLVTALMKDYNRFFQKVVTHTTRKPRPDETDGINYHFINISEYERLKSQNYFVETAKVHNNFYGLSLEAWKRSNSTNKISIFEIDIQGALSIHNLEESLRIKPFYLFIEPPTIEKLHDRLLKRGTETSSEIILRLKNAKIEIESARKSGLFQRTIVCDDFNLAVNEMFRNMRDWYPMLPSAAKLRMLQRRARDIKAKAILETEDMSKMNRTI